MFVVSGSGNLLGVRLYVGYCSAICWELDCMWVVVVQICWDWECM